MIREGSLVRLALAFCDIFFLIYNFLSVPHSLAKPIQTQSRKYRGIFKVKSREKTRQVREHWSQPLDQNKNKLQKGTISGAQKGKRSLLACNIRCKCYIETTRISAKVKLGIKVMKLVKSLLGLEVSVPDWSKVRMSFNIRERKTSYC